MTTPAPPPPGSEQAALFAAALAAQLVAAVQTVMVDAAVEGAVLGRQAAAALITATAVDWDGWAPGDPEAARLVLGKAGDGSGLADLLRDSQVRLADHITARLRTFAKLLADSLQAGDGVDMLAAKIETFAGNHTWAYTVAQTEIARAVSAATLNTYRDNDIEQHTWGVAGLDPLDRVRVCKVCQANGDAGPIPVGDRFPGGVVAPPQHPRCRCCLQPWLDLDGLDAYMDDEDEPVESGALGLDLVAVLREDSVTEFLDESGQLWVWSVEEARYVRTAAGAKRYGLPIGAEIKSRRNRDGYFDDDQVAKRRAYYARARARARARAQQRHAAKGAPGPKTPTLTPAQHKHLTAVVADLPPAMRAPMIRALARHRDYPGLLAAVKKVQLRDDRDIGDGRWSGGYMHVTPTLFDDTFEQSRVLRRTAEQEKGVNHYYARVGAVQAGKATEADALVAHELGHAVMSVVLPKGLLAGLTEAARVAKLPAPKPVLNKWDEIDHEATLEKWVKTRAVNLFLTRQLSVYGAANFHETTAELWSVYSLDRENAPSWIRAYGDTIAQIMRERAAKAAARKAALSSRP